MSGQFKSDQEQVRILCFVIFHGGATDTNRALFTIYYGGILEFEVIFIVIGCNQQNYGINSLEGKRQDNKFLLSCVKYGI